MRINLLFIAPVVLLCGCSDNNTAVKNDSVTSNVKAGFKSTFIDSVLRQDTFTIRQVKQHVIDSSFISNKSHFTGDTVYYPGAAYSLAILRNDDHAVCTTKYLLVYKNGESKNISGMPVGSDCDEDSSTDYSRMEYKVFSSTLFYTREIQHLRDAGKKTKVTVTDKFYGIDDKGKLISLPGKPAGVMVPVFDRDNELDEESKVN